ncbi:MAG: low molecular weight phosphotyrosine protein phosphatase [Propionibacteriaceae bacterium]|nr:low molecular weight phosphotyrosine protein phosphatase [Propionibacteriaceae bacterium]
MAERIAEKMAGDAGLRGVRFTSAGTSSEEAGNPIDPRAAQVLSEDGCRAAHHRAHQITAAEIRDADLVVAMEPRHVQAMRRLVPDAENLALMTDFDPAATPGSGIDDPWYGPASGFRATHRRLADAMPGVLAWVRDHLGE